MELLIVTGLSGAGKSQAIHTLEDIGYYCVDNLPPELLEPFFQLCVSTAKGGNYAAVVDIRALLLFGSVFELKRRFSNLALTPKLLFLESAPEVLLRRYKETRRRHPLMDDESVFTLPQAVERERELLAPVREAADYLVDSSALSPSQLKERITHLFAEEHNTMVVSLYSFGFKHSLPTDVDLLFDVRCLPNPHYIAELRPQTGLDKPVFDYVFGFEEAQGLYARLQELIHYSLPLYRAEGKSRLVIAIGCTGGHHRSVAFVERLAAELAKHNETITVSHRDIGR